jgi:hypothetical protein
VVSLMSAFVGSAMAQLATEADVDTPMEVRVIASDDGEPSVVCTTYAQIVKCREVDLTTNHR